MEEVVHQAAMGGVYRELMRGQKMVRYGLMLG